MSKKTPGSPLDVVTALMEERAKFEAWLSTLEARREATALHVYERVRLDYEGRLQRVVDELKAHAAELEVQAEKFTARLAELSAQEQSRRDERAEAELRAHVGELSPDAWEATAREADQALAAIAAEQAVVGADLNRVHDLLGAAMAPPVAVAREPAPRPQGARDSGIVTEPAMPDPEAAQQATPAPQGPVAQPTPARSSFDELAFLKSVVSPYASSTPVEPAPPAAAAITHDDSDALGPSLVSRAARTSQEREFVREDPTDATSGIVGSVPETVRGGERPFAANVTANNPIVLRPSGAVEQPKTLKCAECAAMNYPTEWYCERCGAELASL
ncbi:MAG: hypothetical protein ACYCVL_12290 [Gemmatimonadaceae bacterium]